jgi:hypothetical protein
MNSKTTRTQVQLQNGCVCREGEQSGKWKPNAIEVATWEWPDGKTLEEWVYADRRRIRYNAHIERTF